MIPGIITLVFTGITAVGAGAWLRATALHPWDWQRKVRAPKVVAEPYYAENYSVGSV